MSRPANLPVDAPKYCIVPRRRPSSFVARMAAVNLAAADTAHSWRSVSTLRTSSGISPSSRSFTVSLRRSSVSTPRLFSHALSWATELPLSTPAILSISFSASARLSLKQRSAASARATSTRTPRSLIRWSTS